MNQELINIMDEFFSTTQYQGEVGDWNTTEETYEDPDEEVEEFSNTTTIIRRYGGPGSGHHGHAGRPGEVGGSGGGGGAGIEASEGARVIIEENENTYPLLRKLFFETQNHPKNWELNFGVSTPIIIKQDIKGKFLGYMQYGQIFSNPSELYLHFDVHKKAKNKISVLKDMYAVLTKEIEKLPVTHLHTEFATREGYRAGMFFMRRTKLKPSKSLLEEIKYWEEAEEFTPIIIRRYGGPGSGHHGHAGRPGEVGGSGGGGRKRKVERSHIFAPMLSREEQIEMDYKAAGIQITREHTNDIIAVIKGYIDGDYKLIRDYQLGRSKSGFGEKGSQLIEEYISVIPSFPKDTPIYRGMPKKREVFKQMSPGDIWDTKAISSWTSDKRVAIDFSGGEGRVVVKLQKGTPPYSCSIRHLSDAPGENEVLLSGKNKLRFVSRREAVQTTVDGKLVGRYLEVTMEYAGV